MGRTLAFHPVANLFPLMGPADFADLKADIQAHGLREPIWTFEGAILDGRNRYRACAELGIEPTLREWGGDGSLVAFVVSLNLHRRHLTSSQRAAVAAEMLPLLEAEAKERQRKAGQQKGRGKVPQKVAEAIPGKGEARQEAARLAGTNRQYVSEAKRIREQAPDLFEMILAGELKVTQARHALKARQERQERRRVSEEAHARGEASRAGREAWDALVAEVSERPDFLARRAAVEGLKQETSRLQERLVAEQDRLEAEIDAAWRKWGSVNLQLQSDIEKEAKKLAASQTAVATH